MKRQTTVHVNTSRGKIEIEGYQTDTDGLIAHRDIILDESEQGWTLGNKWTVTHAGSGLSVLPENAYRRTKRECYTIARKMGDDGFDWSQEEPPEDFTRERFDELLNGVEEESEEEIERFVIQPVVDGYAVVRLSTGEHVEVHPHRGIAARRRETLEEGGED